MFRQSTSICASYHQAKYLPSSDIFPHPMLFFISGTKHLSCLCSPSCSDLTQHHLCLHSQYPHPAVHTRTMYYLTPLPFRSLVDLLCFSSCYSPIFLTSFYFSSSYCHNFVYYRLPYSFTLSSIFFSDARLIDAYLSIVRRSVNYSLIVFVFLEWFDSFPSTLFRSSTSINRWLATSHPTS